MSHRCDTIICVLDAGHHKRGDPPPEGYNAWHEWAKVQHRAGLRQRQCPTCLRWRFPQEFSDTTDEHLHRLCKGCEAERERI